MTPTDPQALIAELRELLAKATAPPWTTDPDCNDETILGPDGYLVADAAVIVPGKQRDCEANAALIVAAVNHLGGVLDGYERALQRVAELERILAMDPKERL